ncbi:MAG TPA: EamA family transporter [Oligoflexia bacterium]|nr:EamA family transporter [Oligoflexia bacterium]HMR25566.1 EamA family transporter [Oligoflexia bacterium]
MRKSLQAIEAKSMQQGIAFVFISALFWSFGGLWIKLIAWPAFTIAGMRALIACLALFFVFRPKRFEFSLMKLLTMLVFAANVISFVVATKLTTAANAVLLQFTAPLYITLFSPFFLKEKIRITDIIILIIGAYGLSLFFKDSGLDLTQGIGMYVGLFAGFTSAWLTMCLRKLKQFSGIELVLWGNVLTAVLCSPSFVHLDLQVSNWLYVALLGLVQVALAYVFYTQALKVLTALQGMLFQLFEPLLNPVWVLIFFGEVPSYYTLIGGSIILATVVLKYIFDRQFKGKLQNTTKFVNNVKENTDIN